MHPPAVATSWFRSRPSITAGAGVVALLVSVLFLVPLPGQWARAQESTVSILGRFRPTAKPGAAIANVTSGSQVYADPVNRVLYSWTNEGYLAAYDLDTLQRRGAHLDVLGTRTSVLVDTISGSLLLPLANRITSTSRIDQFVSRPQGVVLAATLDTTTIVGPGQEVLGLYRDPTRPVLWLLSARPPGGNFTGAVDVTVTELAVPDNNIARAVRNWSKPVPGCQTVMHGIDLIPVGLGWVPAQQAVYFACGHSNGVIKNPPVSRGVGRLVLSRNAAGTTAPGELELFPTPGNFNVADAFFDPISSRMLITTASSQGSSIIIFDSATNTYLGSFATGGNQLEEGALDPVHGRFYGMTGQATLGLVVSDVRATPVRQGYSFPSFASQESQGPIGNFIAVDPITNRVIVKYRTLEDFFVLKDDVPKYTAPPEDDPDRNTVDVAERPGRTTALYSGAAQGYGSRQRQVGGIEGLQVNTIGITNIPYPASKSTRELRTSSLDALTMANQEAAAAAVTADRDDGTEGDASSSPQGDPWPYEPAHCVDFGTDANDDADDGSEVECDAGHSRASARSTFDRSDAGGALIGHTELSAVSRHDTVRGVVTKVTASASGVDVLGGLLRIGGVTAEAEAWAKGRPGTNGTNYERTVRDVEAAGQKLCTGNCNTATLAQQVNTLLAGKVRIEFPNPDRDYAKGSDGGYQALVRRNVAEQIQEQALNGQPPDRIELPAMVITIYQDDSKPGRTVVELAATEAEARYGIALQADDDFDGGSDDGGSDSTFGDLGSLGPLADDTPAFGVFPEDTVPGAALPFRRSPQSLSGAPVSSVGGLLWNGVGRIADLLPIWAVLLTPIYLSARRWLLLQRGTLAPGGTP